MQMQHQFTVPAPVDVAWSTLLDLERVAPCMPGATLKEVDGDDFTGSVKVKLGPVSLLYKGSGTFTETNSAAHRVVIDASGKDSRGNGTAAATVTAELSPLGQGTTVTVDTDLKITGKPAQFGRGMIHDVAEKLITQFSDCLEERLVEPAAAEEVEERAVTERTGAVTGPVVGESGPEVHGTSEPRPATPAGEVPEQPEESEAATRATTADSAGGATRAEPAPSSGEAIDLLGTAGAPVLKRLAPVPAGIAGLVAVVVLFRRRRRAR